MLLETGGGRGRKKKKKKSKFRGDDTEEKKPSSRLQSRTRQPHEQLLLHCSSLHHPSD